MIPIALGVAACTLSACGVLPGTSADRQGTAATSQVQVEVSPTAVVGSDGWVFYGDAYNRNYAQATGARTLSAGEVDAFANWVADIRDLLADQGVEFVLVMAPAKWEVYGEKLGRPATASSPMDQILDAYPDLPIVDTRQALIDGRATADTFSKLNGHWTGFGGYVAWQDIQDELATLAPSMVAPVPPISGVSVTDQGVEFPEVAGTSASNPWTMPVFDPPLPEVQFEGQDGAMSSMSAAEPTDMLFMPRTTINPNAPSPTRVLALCDSTCRGISPEMQASYASLTQVQHSAVQPETVPDLTGLLEAHQPQAVILLMTERYLDLPPTSLPK